MRKNIYEVLVATQILLTCRVIIFKITVLYYFYNLQKKIDSLNSFNYIDRSVVVSFITFNKVVFWPHYRPHYFNGKIILISLINYFNTQFTLRSAFS